MLRIAKKMMFYASAYATGTALFLLGVPLWIPIVAGCIGASIVIATAVHARRERLKNKAP